MTEFNLSNKIDYDYDDGSYPEDSSIRTENVKEFIKRLKESCIKLTKGTMEINYQDLMKVLDKLAGEKLK